MGGVWTFRRKWQFSTGAEVPHNFCNWKISKNAKGNNLVIHLEADE